MGEVYVAPFDSVLSDTDVVQPELLLISRGREHTLTDKNVRGAPYLTIEILSPSTADRDLGYKYEVYGRHGMLKNWIVDPMEETIAGHRQRDERIELAETFGHRDTLRSGVLEGLLLKVDEIFRSGIITDTHRQVGCGLPGGPARSEGRNEQTRDHHDRKQRKAFAAVWWSTPKCFAIPLTRTPRANIAPVTPAMTW